MPDPHIRERLRRKANSRSPLSQAMDDDTFARVEAGILERHHRELGGAPVESDPRSLARHLQWWARVHPGGDIDYDDPENVALHVLCYHANRRLLQRVEALPVEDRKRVLDAFGKK